MDAAAIIAYKEVFKDSKNSYATFSDWFRIKLLYDLGGWWVDCDTFCLKKFTFKAAYVFATECFKDNNEKYMRICNAVIKMRKRSAIGRELLKRIDEILKVRDVKDIKWTEIGARILASEIIKEDLSKFVVIPEVFCPNDYTNYRQLIDLDGLSFDKRTYAVHLWNKMWEWNKLNPLAEIKEGSFLSRAVQEI